MKKRGQTILLWSWAAFLVLTLTLDLIEEAQQVRRRARVDQLQQDAITYREETLQMLKELLERP